MAHPLLSCECSAANMTVLLRKDVIAYYGLEDKYDTLDSFQWGQFYFI